MWVPGWWKHLWCNWLNTCLASKGLLVRIPVKAVVLQGISAVCVILWVGKEFLRTGVDVVSSISTRCGSLVGGSLCGVVVADLSF